jgi:hypothetical protein
MLVGLFVTSETASSLPSILPFSACSRGRQCPSATFWRKVFQKAARLSSEQMLMRRLTRRRS